MAGTPAPDFFDQLDPKAIPRRWSWKRWLALVVTVCCLAFAAVFGYLWYEAQSVVNQFSAGDKQQVVDATAPELGKSAQKPLRGLRDAETYLLIGSDARPGETASRSDTTLLVRVYPKEKMASILSIPRDMWVPIPGYGEDRINAAYAYGGVPLLAATLREWIGVPIDHFFQVGFSSFAGVVDDLDGVYLPIDQTYYHVNDGTEANNWAAIDVKHGYQKLDGEDALSWVRFRHLDSDFYRAARQQVFLREAGRQLRQEGLGGMRQIIDTVAKGTTSDIKLNSLISLSNTLRAIPAERIVRVTMPGTGTSINGASVLLADETEKEQVLDYWNNPEQAFADQERKPPPQAQETLKYGLLRYLGTNLRPFQPDYGLAAIAASEELRRADTEKRARQQTSQKEQETEAPLQEVTPPATPDKEVPSCTPTKLPDGYYWPDDATRSYQLNGYPSASSYATQGSGISIMWMWSNWLDPPILDSPADALRAGGRTYQLYWEASTLRMIAWRQGRGLAWIHNTLQSELSQEEMIDLAKSCR